MPELEAAPPTGQDSNGGTGFVNLDQVINTLMTVKKNPLAQDVQIRSDAGKGKVMFQIVITQKPMALKAQEAAASAAPPMPEMAPAAANKGWTRTASATDKTSAAMRERYPAEFLSAMGIKG